MKAIKDWVITRLGGYTIQDVEEIRECHAKFGRTLGTLIDSRKAHTTISDYEWLKNLYEHGNLVVLHDNVHVQDALLGETLLVAPWVKGCVFQNVQYHK